MMSARPTESPSVHMGVRLPRRVLDSLDAEVERLEQLLPPELRDRSRITRSSVARALILRELDAQRPGPQLTWGECLEVPHV